MQATNKQQHATNNSHILRCCVPPQNGAVVASSSLWQITEAVPLLSAEPSLAEALLDEGQGLVELVASADIAVNALLNGQQVG